MLIMNAFQIQRFHWVPLSLLCIALWSLTACDRTQPQSYQIPKEERPANLAPIASTPSTTKTTATVEAETQPQTQPQNGNSMRVLPGMAEAAKAAGAIQFVTPENWEARTPSGIRKADLYYTNPSTGETANIAVTVFPGDVGGLLANINRWRGQVELPAINSDALAECINPRILSNHSGTYARLIGTQRSILGGLLPFHGKTWFFKLLGDTATVLEQESAFNAFLDSVRIEDPHH